MEIYKIRRRNFRSLYFAAECKHFLLLVFLTFFAACNPRNAGPVGSFYNGFYKLDYYAIKGSSVPLSVVTDFAYLETQQDKDSMYFIYKNVDRKVTLRQVLISSSFDVNRKRTIGYYGLKTSDGKSAKAILTWNKTLGVPIKLELTNFMKGDYNRSADTVRFIYLSE